MSDKRFDAVPILAAVSGQTEGQVKSLWEQVKANHARLAACPGHRFADPWPLPEGIRGQLTCSRCGSSIRLTAVCDYIRGYAAAGGDPAEVWPAWQTKRGGAS